MDVDRLKGPPRLGGISTRPNASDASIPADGLTREDEDPRSRTVGRPTLVSISPSGDASDDDARLRLAIWLADVAEEAAIASAHGPAPAEASS